MPTPTAVDVIAASIQDIANALEAPKPNLSLNPLTAQQSQALQDLVTVFTGTVSTDDSVETPSSLRRRVETPRDEGPVLVQPLNTQPAVPSLHCQPAPLAPTTYADAICRKPRSKGAVSDSTTSITTTTTLHHLAPAAASLSPSSKLVQPCCSTRCQKPKVLNSLQAERSSNLSKAASDTVPAAQPSSNNISNDSMFWALNSTAINPNTQLVAKYDKLSKSSDGKLSSRRWWIQANTEEFGRLAQGLGKDSSMPTGTDTIFFIHPSQMPNGCKATYLQIVCAYRPEKPQPRQV